MNQRFPISRNACCLTDGETRYDASSRTEPKRSHHGLVESSEQELFYNKRQAIESVSSRQFPVNSNEHFSLGENLPCFQPASGQLIGRLFGPEPITTSNIAGRNASLVNVENLIRERKGFEDHVGNPSFFNLSMAHAMEYPSSYADYGVRKVKVSEVRDSQKGISLPGLYAYSRGDNHTISLNTDCNKTNYGISLGPTSDEGNGSTFQKIDKSFTSTGLTFDNRDENFTMMRHDINKGYSNMLSMGQPFNKADGNYILVDQWAGKHDDLNMSMDHTYNKGPDNFFSMVTSYNKADVNLFQMLHTFDKGNESVILVDPTNAQGDHSNFSMFNAKGDPVSGLQNPNNGEGTAVYFGGWQGDPEVYNSSGSVVSSYDLLINQASSGQGQDDLIEGNTGPNVNVALVATSKAAPLSKKKERKAIKKISPNSFPSNVKSLLSTGILDGVQVKYVSWSREKKLRGIIKGTSYLCGCQDCNLSKLLNAFEFECHAGCKTKHPNNHIYFQNGKTIYAVVQELKSTPQEVLFEVIQNITGSPIDQENFNIWKASHVAASRELARIYGSGDVAMPL